MVDEKILQRATATRRLLVAGFVGAAAAMWGRAAGAAAPSVDDLPLTPLPAGADPDSVAGLSWFGAGPKAIEIFDYNCPYCRTAFKALDGLVAQKKLRLGLMDSPMLSLGSVQAAKLRQAVLVLYGPDKAFEFHRRLMAKKGAVDGDAAMAVVEAMGLPAEKLADSANSEEVRNRIIGQMRFLDHLGVSTTPSFLMGGRMLAGWPGLPAFLAALSA